MSTERATSNKRHDSADFVEAPARGLDVIRVVGPTALEMTVSEAASRTGLARPTARRILITLEELGYVRSTNGGFTLTTKTLELGTAYISALGIWEVARPHLVESGQQDRRIELDGAARRQRHRVHGESAGPQDHRPVGQHRDTLPSRRHLDGTGVARRAVVDGARRRAGASVRFGNHPPGHAQSAGARCIARRDPPTWLGDVRRAALRRHPLRRCPSADRSAGSPPPSTSRCTRPRLRSSDCSANTSPNSWRLRRRSPSNGNVYGCCRWSRAGALT